MAKARTINAAITRTFDQASSIVYFVSDNQQIIYANQACADWLEVDLELLVGTRTVYSSETLSDEMENRIKGLALAPERFNLAMCATEGETPDSNVRISVSRNGRLTWLDAQVNLVRDEDEKLAGYLVVADSVVRRVAETTANTNVTDSSQRIHETLALIRNDHQSRFSLQSLIGDSAQMKRVHRQATAASKLNADLLVVGPPGSGREHLVRSVFAQRNLNAIEGLGQGQGDDQKSKSTDLPGLFPIHCAIVDPVQIQQTMKELVADRKKRTSASNPSIGPDAHPDTLLLIDVDLLSESSQLELLGFLELPEFPFCCMATALHSLVGANNETGASGDESADANETFIPDLASRLGTMVIELVALKDRREDLPVLAQAILERNNESRARQLSGFSTKALETLCEFDWPGNFDQLTSVIDEAASAAEGNKIEFDDLPITFRQAIDAARSGQAKEVSIELDDYLAGIEKELVKRALAAAKGNKTRAAKMLGVSRPKLLRRLQHFGLMGNEDELLDASVFKEADE